MNPKTSTTKFVDPPASDKVLQNLIDKVIIPPSNNQSVTVITFPGAGKGAETKYLLSNHNKIPGFPPNHLATWLDMETFRPEEDFFFRNALQYIENFFTERLTDSAKRIMTETLNLQDIQRDKFEEVIFQLTRKDNFTIAIYLANFQLLSHASLHIESVKTLDYIRRISPHKISLSFYSHYEYDDAAIAKLGPISLYFAQSFVYGKDVEFDDESANRLFANQEKWNKIKFDPKFIQKAKELTPKDPSVMKYIAVKGLSDKEFQKSLIQENDIDKAYSIIGETWLDNRYRMILESLSSTSLAKLLQDKIEDPTPHLINTGIVDKFQDKNTFQVMNKLFAHYIEKSLDQIKTSLLPSAIQPISEDKSKVADLTAKELLVLRALEYHQGKTVTREEIASIMWGEEWENKYSDWAIDKLMSNMRKKLEGSNYAKSIKVLKGKGFILA